MDGCNLASTFFLFRALAALKPNYIKRDARKKTKKYFGDIQVDPMNSNPVLDWNKICQLAVKSADDVILEPFYN